MSYSPYNMYSDDELLDLKTPMNVLRIDRTVIRDLHLEHGLEYEQFDDDMIIEFCEKLQEEGFDMDRIEDIEVVKEFTMENDLIFLQPDI